MRSAMREGALLGIIDRTGKGDDHGIDPDTVVKEAQRAGFVLVEQHDFVRPDEVDYFLVFRWVRVSVHLQSLPNGRIPPDAPDL